MADNAGPTDRKRILYVENGIGYGGAIICLRHLVRNLDRTRFEPLVITGRGDALYRDIAQEAPWRHVPDRLIDLAPFKRRLDAAHWPDKLPGLRFLLGQFLARADDLCNFLPSFLGTLWVALRFQPHLIHANNEPLCNRSALLVGKLLNIPVVSHVRGDQQGSAMMRWFYRIPTRFIAVSRWVSDSLGRLGIAETKRGYVYDGIELDKLDLQADGLAFRRRYGVPDQAIAVGLVGLLIPWKGQRLFLQAGHELLERHPDLYLLIVGGTPAECVDYERELRAEAASARHAERIIFTGHQTGMPAVYKGLDVVVSASTSPEPLGTMIIECLAMARPLIAPDHGGALEMVEHERTGLLFEAGNASDLAAAIERLCSDASLRRILGAAARQHALETFSIEQHINAVQNVYDDVLGATRQAGHDAQPS
ncbi:glycosyltransferase family 4 protein [Methylococcus sp. EFPC2]|uniref:glycosyltransferase family 4 protein n=1 Tax=Methylococcus sp. EFPC2 TaxID=2812648 RepID=UPI001967D70B|nr:glycosyltransferase family 4 protein [Methylococcus sp. EFPC2]QSA97611.1 glycosyltransferase family 4 protein [Methylococcus sp. EFPC2]